MLKPPNRLGHIDFNDDWHVERGLFRDRLVHQGCPSVPEDDDDFPEAVQVDADEVPDDHYVWSSVHRTWECSECSATVDGIDFGRPE